MKNDLKKKLTCYSRLSGTMILITSAADAQIIYTNPPDINLSGNSEYDLDLNNDGIVEATLIHSETSGDGYMLIQKNYNQEEQEWLGYVFWLYNAPPVPIKAGKKIGPQIPPKMRWTDGEFSSVALMCMPYDTYFNIWAGKNNRFIGFRFTEQNVPNEWHYGWVRLSVFPGCTGAIIKDWAYNSVANSSILAGQTMKLSNEDAYSEESTTLSDLTVHGYGHQIYVKDNRELLNLEINVYSLIGQQLALVNSSDEQTVIQLSEAPAGIYIVQLKHDGEVTSRQVVIE